MRWDATENIAWNCLKNNGSGDGMGWDAVGSSGTRTVKFIKYLAEIFHELSRELSNSHVPYAPRLAFRVGPRFLGRLLIQRTMSV